MKVITKGSSQAEQYALANALHIVARDYDLSQYKLIVYSDNMYALRNHVDGTAAGKRDWSKVYKLYIRPHIEAALEYQARHVKAHLPPEKWSRFSARHYMQNWCDEEVHRVMKVAAREVVEAHKLAQKSACVPEEKGA